MRVIKTPVQVERLCVEHGDGTVVEHVFVPGRNDLAAGVNSTLLANILSAVFCWDLLGLTATKSRVTFTLQHEGSRLEAHVDATGGGWAVDVALTDPSVPQALTAKASPERVLHTVGTAPPHIATWPSARERLRRYDARELLPFHASSIARPVGWIAAHEALAARWDAALRSRPGSGWIRGDLDAWCGLVQGVSARSPWSVWGSVDRDGLDRGACHNAPSDFDDWMFAYGATDRDDDVLSFHCDEFSVLRQIRDTLGLADLTARLVRTARLEFECHHPMAGAFLAPHFDYDAGFSFEVQRLDGRRCDQNHLSLAEQWVAAFLWFAETNVSGPILVSFPVDLEPRLEVACLAAVEGRQVIVVG